MPTPQSLIDLYTDINFDESSIGRPKDFVFFCGGRFSENNGPAETLRHYLLKERDIEKKIAARIVLAEVANQLYRDSNYTDLITFEEDIATIAVLVLIIVESAGSLAELGAFATSEKIRNSTSVILKSEFEDSESFVRFGPVQKLINESKEKVAFYPWKNRKDSKIVKNSVRSHFRSIVKFINEQIRAKPKHFLSRNNADFLEFARLFWIMHISRAISITEIESYTRDLGIIGDRKSIRNKLYCMKLAGWVDKFSYSNKEYWHPLVDKDPIFRYVFRENAVEKNRIRRKIVVIEDVRKGLKIPKNVLREVSKRMGLAP